MLFVFLTITISSGQKTQTINTIDYSVCKTDEGKEDELCTLNIAKYIGKKHTDLSPLKTLLTVTEITVTDGATEENSGRIKSINNETTGTIDLTTENSIKIEYYLYVKDNSQESSQGQTNEQQNNDSSQGESSGSQESNQGSQESSQGDNEGTNEESD